MPARKLTVATILAVVALTTSRLTSLALVTFFLLTAPVEADADTAWHRAVQNMHDCFKKEYSPLAEF